MRVLVFGTFDRLHPGHRFVLERAAERGDVFAVVARDRNVERIKGRAPEENEETRRTAVEAALPGVTAVLGDPSDFLAPVRAIKPDLILLGYDQKLPPGVTDADFPCPVERLEGFEPHKHKSSLMRQRGGAQE